MKKAGSVRVDFFEDGLHAEVRGAHAVPLGIANSSLVKALNNRPEEGLGSTFEAFVIPKRTDRVNHE